MKEQKSRKCIETMKKSQVLKREKRSIVDALHFVVENFHMLKILFNF